MPSVQEPAYGRCSRLHCLRSSLPLCALYIAGAVSVVALASPETRTSTASSRRSKRKGSDLSAWEEHLRTHPAASQFTVSSNERTLEFPERNKKNSYCPKIAIIATWEAHTAELTMRPGSSDALCWSRQTHLPLEWAASDADGADAGIMIKSLNGTWMRLRMMESVRIKCISSCVWQPSKSTRQPIGECSFFCIVLSVLNPSAGLSPKIVRRIWEFNFRLDFSYF